MKLPNGDRAIVEIEKLETYVLNPFHPLGKHKARVFASALGLTLSDGAELKAALLRAAREGEAVEGERDDYGRRFSIDFTMEHADIRARIRSGWIIRHAERIPRLTTCFVL